MGDASQTGFNTTNNNGLFIRFFTALSVNRYRSVGALAMNITRRVSIVVAQLTICRVMVDHGIHVASGYAEKERWLTQRHKGVFRCPVGLGNNADSITLCFQRSAYNRHAKAGVINISIASD